MSNYDDDIYDYILKVHMSGFKVRYVQYIDFETNMIYFTKDKYEAGAFNPYERAVQIANFLENESYIKKVEIIQC